MKSKKCILNSLPVLCCFICGLALSSELEKSVDEEQTREMSVWIGNDEIPLLFVEDGLSLALKQSIAEDLELVLSHLSGAVFVQRKTPRVVVVGDRDLQLTHRLIKRTKGSSVPSDVLPNVLKSGHFGKAVRTNGTYSLVIDQEIISEYKTAVTLKNEHPEMFAELDDFIDMLEAQKKMKDISSDWETCSQFVYRYSEMSKRAALEFIREYASGKTTVRNPSLLEIQQLNKADKNSEAPDNVFVMSSVIDWQGNQEHLREKNLKLPLGAYVDGEWRIFAFRMP